MKDSISLEGRQCPICGKGILRRRLVEKTFSYHGENITFHDYVVYVCDACGEELIPGGANKATNEPFIEFCRRVDGLLTPGEIRGIRRRLHLTQTKLAELLGVGEKTFARYEAGTVAQGRAMDNLLRILDASPEARGILLKQSTARRAVTTCAG